MNKSKNNARYVQMIKVQRAVKSRIDSGKYKSDTVYGLHELIQTETNRYIDKL